jgi:hypothetical protein
MVYGQAGQVQRVFPAMQLVILEVRSFEQLQQSGCSS